MAEPVAAPYELSDDATDALVNADVGIRSGTARAALRHRQFRIVWWGTIGSNIGTWMQNIVLAAFILKLTNSALYVGLVSAALLGPLLLLANVGGVLADTVDRRRLLIWANLEQLVLSFVLAGLAAGHHPSPVWIVVCVLAIGAGNAIAAPSLSAVLPTLVPSEDLPGAVSLQSFQMNASRVIGPAIGGILYPAFGPAVVFAVNAVTYLFAVVALVVADFEARVDHQSDERGLARLLSGFRVASRDRLVRRVLVTIATMSFFSLAFIGLMPVLAKDNLGLDVRSLEYGLLYAAFGTGAALGAVSIGTLLVGRSKPRIVRVGLAAFAVLLAAFGLVRDLAAAYAVVVVLGFAYFSVVTSLLTVLQQHLDDRVRGRVLALWIMAFGGTVPLGTLAGGAVADATSVTAVLLAGAAWAAFLAWFADLRASGAPG